jgi:hypothetical protein
MNGLKTDPNPNPMSAEALRTNQSLSSPCFEIAETFGGSAADIGGSTAKSRENVLEISALGSQFKPFKQTQTGDLTNKPNSN